MRNHSLLNRGFGLIEVLVAVVVLSVGLLALALLQTSLIRSSADAKAQSTAIGLAKQRIEQLVSFQTTGGTDNTCVSPATSNTNTCYRAIADEGATVVDGDPAVVGNQPIGGISFTRAVDVKRYVFNKATGIQQFVLQSTDTALDSTLLTSPITYLAGKEFKRVAVTVAWTDALGQARNVVAEDVIGAINPADSAALSKTGKGAAPRKAIAIITNPASVAGVIPIAIGNGTDTAATNPRPIVVSQGNSSTTVETRFDIYTYAALNNSAAQAQSRVETSVVGCKCSLTSATQAANRPTFWDGTQYTIPETASGIPVSTPVNSVTQSEQCTVCCRDHHDPAGVAGEKFDPRRITHNHYLASDLTTVIDTGHPGVYNESCRLIRVDGIFRVATEPYDDHYGLLATVGLLNSTAATTVANAVPPTGTGSISDLYQTFVLNNLRDRFVNGTNYNTVLDPTTVAGYSSLQGPASASINGSTSPQYMHTRALVIDYLGTKATQAIAAAKAQCIIDNCSAAQLQTAVLRLLPFTSINTTELAKWFSSNASKVGVSLLQDFSESINQSLPVSGKAAYNSGVSGDSVAATTTIQGSSAGLAIAPKVFPDSEYANNALTDTQAFTIGSGGVVGPYPGGESFSLRLFGSDLLANVLVGNPAQVYFGSPTYKSCSPDAASMTPYTCTTDTNFALGGSTPIKIGNYNRSGSTPVLNSCSRGGNSSNDTDTIPMPYAIVFDVQSATLNSSTIPSTQMTVVNPDMQELLGSTQLSLRTRYLPGRN